MLWRVVNKSLPIHAELIKRGINCPIICPRCHLKMETINHLFMECTYSVKVWFGSQLNIKKIYQPVQDFTTMITDNILHQKRDIIIQLAALTYNLWHARNQAIFEDTFVPKACIIQRAQTSVQKYLQAKEKTPEAQQHSGHTSNESHNNNIRQDSRGSK